MSEELLQLLHEESAPTEPYEPSWAQLQDDSTFETLLSEAGQQTPPHMSRARTVQFGAAAETLTEDAVSPGLLTPTIDIPPSKIGNPYLKQATMNQETALVDDPAHIAATLSTCAARLGETAVKMKSGEMSCRSAVLQGLMLLRTAAASRIPGVTSQEIMVKIIPGFVPPEQPDIRPLVAPPAPPAPPRLCPLVGPPWSFKVGPYYQGFVWQDGYINDGNVNQPFAQGSDAMNLYNLRREQGENNISAPLVVPGYLTPPEPTTG